MLVHGPLRMCEQYLLPWLAGTHWNPHVILHGRSFPKWTWDNSCWSWQTALNVVESDAGFIVSSREGPTIRCLSPVLKRNELHHRIPIGIHGDGGACSHHDSLLVFAWNSLHGTL